MLQCILKVKLTIPSRPFLLSRFSKGLLRWLAMASGMILAGCEKSEKQETASLGKSPPAVEREAAISFDAVGIPAISDDANWPTEVFTERAGDQLKRLK